MIGSTTGGINCKKCRKYVSENGPNICSDCREEVYEEEKITFEWEKIFCTTGEQVEKAIIPEGTLYQTTQWTNNQLCTAMVFVPARSIHCPNCDKEQKPWYNEDSKKLYDNFLEAEKMDCNKERREKWD